MSDVFAKAYTSWVNSFLFPPRRSSFRDCLQLSYDTLAQDDDMMAFPPSQYVLAVLDVLLEDCQDDWTYCECK